MASSIEELMRLYSPYGLGQPYSLPGQAPIDLSSLLQTIEPPPPPPEPEMSNLERLQSFLSPETGAFAARVGLPIVGGVLGAYGGPLGVMAGAGVGGALGEAIGQEILGEEIRPEEVALAGGLAALPAGPIGRQLAKPGLGLARRALLHAGEGATQGLLDVGAFTALREGRLPTAEEAQSGLIAGTVLGGTLGLGLEAVPAIRGMRQERGFEQAVADALSQPPGAPRLAPTQEAPSYVFAGPEGRQILTEPQLGFSPAAQRAVEGLPPLPPPFISSEALGLERTLSPEQEALIRAQAQEAADAALLRQVLDAQQYPPELAPVTEGLIPYEQYVAQRQSSLDQALAGLTGPAGPPRLREQPVPRTAEGRGEVQTPATRAVLKQQSAQATQLQRTPEEVAADLAAVAPQEPRLPDVWEGQPVLRSPEEVAEDLSDVVAERALDKLMSEVTTQGGEPRAVGPGYRLSPAARRAMEAAQEPSKESMVRLYRGEGAPPPGPAFEAAFPESAKNRGTWFTDSLDEAKGYGNEILAVDVPAEEAAKFRYGPMPGAEGFSQYRLPQDYLKRSRPVEAAQEPPRAEIPTPEPPRPRETEIAAPRAVEEPVPERVEPVPIREELPPTVTTPTGREIPSFGAFVQSRVGRPSIPDVPAMRGFRDEYLKLYPEADREQFRPFAGRGELTQYVEPTAVPRDLEATARARAEAIEDARRLVSDSEAEAELRSIGETLKSVDLRKNPDFLRQAGLESIQADKPKLIRAIKQDKDNPLWLQAREDLRQTLAEGRQRDSLEPEGEVDTSFRPEEFEGARYAVRPRPGQRGLPGVGQDIPQRAERPMRPGDRDRGVYFLRNVQSYVPHPRNGISVVKFGPGGYYVIEARRGKILNAVEVLDGAVSMVAGGPRLWGDSSVPSVGGVLREVERRGWKTVDPTGDYTDAGYDMAVRHAEKTGTPPPDRYFDPLDALEESWQPSHAELDYYEKHGKWPEPAKDAEPKFATAPERPVSPRDVDKLGFYSQLSRTVSRLPQAMSGNDMLRYLSDPKRGVRAAELKWTGLDDYLKERAGQKVTPQEVQEFVKQNEVQVREVVLGGPKRIEQRGPRAWAVIDSDGRVNRVVNREDEARAIAEAGTSPTEFHKYQLPGGTNYRELLLTLPERGASASPMRKQWAAWDGDEVVAVSPTGIGRDWVARGWRVEERMVLDVEADRRGQEARGNYRSTHWDQPNVLAHVRLNDRVDADGKRTLFVEEIQSDWGERGRREGFEGPNVTVDALMARNAEIERLLPPLRVRAADGDAAVRRELMALNEEQSRNAQNILMMRRIGGKVPFAPYVTDTSAWTELAMKRIIRMAAEDGYDRVAWTTGEQQAARYDLSKQIDNLRVAKDGDKYHLRGVIRGGDSHEFGSFSAMELPNVVGKDLTDRIIKDFSALAPSEEPLRVYRDADLRVGGEGMAGYYDQIVPNVANKIGKKWGVRVGETRLETYTPSSEGARQYLVSERGDGRWHVVDEDGNLKAGPFATEAEALGHPLMQDRVAVHSLDITPEMRRSVTEEGFPRFRAQERGEAPQVRNPLTLERVSEANPGLDWQPREDYFVAKLADGGEYRVRQDGTIEVVDRAAFEASQKAGGVEGEEGFPRGMYRRFGKDSIVSVIDPDSTLDHEFYHFVRDRALNEKERTAARKRYKDEEAEAYAYEEWRKTRKGVNSWFSKIFAYGKRLVHHFRPTWESTFEEVASGRAAKRVAAEAAPLGVESYAVRPKRGPGEKAAEPQPEPGGGDPITRIREEIEKDEFDHYGIRILGRRHVRLGEVLKPSREFRDDKPTGRILDGTSVLYIRKGADPSEVVRLARNYGNPGNAVVLVGSNRDIGIGVDRSERLLDKPVVLAVLGHRYETFDSAAPQERVAVPKYAAAPAPEPGGGEDYRGLHQAPDRESGSPLHDLQNTYPEDIYGPMGAQYYGHYGQNDPMDRESVGIIRSFRGRPNKSVRIYRAVPHEKTNAELIAHYELQKRNILRRDILPPEAKARGMNTSQYYEWASSEIERLKAAPETATPKPDINPGDWVTINRRYAKEHGESSLGGKYKIISKVIRAKDIYTNGDSIHEWGYDPSESVAAPQERVAVPKYAAAPAPAPRPGPQPQPQRRISVPEEKWLKRQQRFWQDKFNRIGTVQEAVVRGGGRLREATDVKASVEAFGSKVAEKLDSVGTKYVNPLIKGLSETDTALEDLGDYMSLLHAPERDAYVSQITNGQNQHGSGWQPQDVAARWSELERKFGTRRNGRIATLERHANIIRRMRDEQLDILVDGGLLSQQQANAWKRDFQDYVPLRHHETDEGFGTGQGFDIRGREAKQITGRSSRAENPIAFMLQQHQKAIVRAEKNKIDQRLAKLIEENPDNTFWEVDRSHKKRQVVKGQVQMVRDFAAEQNDLKFKIDGEEHRITLEDPLLKRAMENASAQETGAFVRRAGAATRLYSQLVTTWSPEFMFTNFTRDVQTAGINLGAERGPKVAKAAAKKVFPAMRAMWKVLKDPNARGQMEQFAREFREDGGAIGFYALKDIPQLQKELQRKLKLSGPGTLQAGKRAAIGFKEVVERANKSVENGTRLAAYVALRDSGLSRQEAARAARNLTVNFTQKGEAGPVMNSLYAFFNANVQGTKRLVDVLRSKSGAKVAAGLIAAGATMDLYNRSIAKDSDNDGTNDYDDIPEYIKERNLVFMREGKPILFPMPYGYNVLHNLGRHTAAYMSGATTAGKAASGLASSAWNAFNPLGGEADLVQTLSPTMLDPVVQHVMNRDFTGNRIRPEKYPGQAKPDAELYFKNVPPLAREIARVMNEYTGGDKVTSGLIDVSPETIDHIFRFASGGLGRFGSNIATMAQNLAEGEIPSVRNVPLARRFVYEERPGAQGQKYRENVEELDQLWNRYKTYRLERNAEAIKKLPKPMLRIHSQVEEIDRRIRSLRRLGKAAERPDIQKRIEELQKRANKLIAQARDANR